MSTAPKFPPLAAVLAVMTTVQILLAGAFNAAGVLAPVAAPDLGLSPASIGTYVGVLSFSSLAGGMLIDGVLRRHGGARTLQVAMATVGAGSLLAASGQLVLVMLSSVVVGWGGGMMVPSALHLLSRVTPPNRMGLAVAINQCGIPLGYGIAGVVMPLLLHATSWQMTLALLAAVLFAGMGLLQLMRESLDSDRVPGAPMAGRALLEPMQMAWNDPTLRLLGWVALFYMTVQICLVTYLVSYVDLELHHSHLAAGTALLASQLAAVCVRLLLGWMLDRVGRHLLILSILGLGSGITAIALAAAVPAWPYALIVTLAALAGGFMIGWNAVYFAAVAYYAPPGRSGTAVGGTQIFTAVGATLGPLIFQGIVTSTGRYSVGFLVLSASSLAMCARLFLRGPSRRSGSMPERQAR